MRMNSVFKILGIFLIKVRCLQIQKTTNIQLSILINTTKINDSKRHINFFNF